MAGGGICGVIFRRAGFAKLSAACDRYKTPLNDGDAVITPAFDMTNAKYIIHAVGPNFASTPTAFEELFYAYYNSLLVLMENGLNSISFPLISSGIYGGDLENPVAESTKQCLRAYGKFTADYPEYDVDVKLCAFAPSEMVRAKAVFDSFEIIIDELPEGELDEENARILEARLLAIECDENDVLDERGLSKIALFWLYYDGVYDNDGRPIEAPTLKDRRKAAEIFRYEVITNGDLNPYFDELKLDDTYEDMLSDAYSLNPKSDNVVRTFLDFCLVKGYTDRVVEIISNADESTAVHIALDIFDEWSFYFEYEGEEYDPEGVDRIMSALAKKSSLKETLRSLYRSGRGDLVIAGTTRTFDIPTLKDERKAKELE